MSKAQTDIRRTSYDAASANPNGYQGSLDDALAQVSQEPDRRSYSPGAVQRGMRAELLMFLGVDLRPGTADDEDWSVEYGIARIEPKRAPSPYSLEYAQQRWPQNFLATDMPELPLTWGLPS